MKYGVREICDVVLRAKTKQKLGSRTFYENEPVIYFDTLKTSSLEGASSTVYAQGGKGNPRLIAWEGERTLTFTMEDALISSESFSILSGADLLAPEDTNGEAKAIFVHTTSQVQVGDDNKITLKGVKACFNADEDSEYYHKSAEIFLMKMNKGEIEGEPSVPAPDGVEYVGDDTIITYCGPIKKGTVVLVDYYVKKTTNATQIEITADKFGGNYYLEASTLFRRESDGVDMPAEFVIPNCKIQSNFTFSMAASGDPSTFTFTIDAFPGYTKFDETHKVLAAIQVINEDGDTEEDVRNCENF